MRKMREALVGCAVVLGGLLASCDGPTPRQGKDAANGGKVEPFTAETLTLEERQARHFTPEILMEPGRSRAYTLSPDGSRAAYTVTRYNVSEDASRTAIYVQDVKKTEGVLVADDGSSPKWINNGSAIAFLRNVDGTSQLFSVNAEGGAATQLTKFDHDINAFWVSPDNSQLLYATQVQVEKTTLDRYPGMSKAKVRIIDSLMYRHWSYWVDGKYSHLLLTKFEGDKTTRGRDIMEGEPWDSPLAPYCDDADVAWAADSKSIFYTSKKSTGREYATTTNSNIYRYQLANGSTEVLTASNKGYDKLPVVSPDGTKLLWQRMVTPGYESDRARCAWTSPMGAWRS